MHLSRRMPRQQHKRSGTPISIPHWQCRARGKMQRGMGPSADLQGRPSLPPLRDVPSGLQARWSWQMPAMPSRDEQSPSPRRRIPPHGWGVDCASVDGDEQRRQRGFLGGRRSQVAHQLPSGLGTGRGLSSGLARPHGGPL